MATPAAPSSLPNGASKPAKPPRNRRPNYNAIHANPLPLKTYPLPPLIPSNPLSIVHIAYIWLSQFLFPPSSHSPTLYQAYWSPETRSVHVTDEATARVFWENGFFGKGSLSRSEPNWVEKERKRRGIVKGDTAEEVTRKRRAERREFKLERARKEREIIEGRLREEGREGKEVKIEKEERREEGEEEERKKGGHEAVIAKGRGNAVDGEELLDRGMDEDLKGDGTEEDRVDGHCSEPRKDDDNLEPVETLSTKEASAESALDPPNKAHRIARSRSPPPISPTDPPAQQPFSNQEHLQLNLEEAFFLAWGLGVLEILSPETLLPLLPSSLLPLFRAHSSFPPIQPTTPLSPDDPFLLSYVSYHHYRSLGWVVRPGIKFGVDWLLYLRGPVFTHAEFAVKVLPAYGVENGAEEEGEEGYWYATEERAEKSRRREGRRWDWLHCAQRVQSQVRKSLVLCYVEVPPPLEGEGGNGGGDVVRDVKEVIQRYRVRDFIVKRWVPNRNLK